MPSAWTQNFYHIVFSTKQRAKLITPEIEERLYPFVGGIVRDLRCALLAITTAFLTMCIYSSATGRTCRTRFVLQKQSNAEENQNAEDQRGVHQHADPDRSSHSLPILNLNRHNDPLIAVVLC